MTLNSLQNQPDLFLLKCISGSRAYGTQLPTSDTDVKGIFILPQKDLYGLRYTEQVNDDRNDTVFYEIKRFMELLFKNNPNILELLATPDDCVLYRHPSVLRLKSELFLSKLCRFTFAQYAFAQIKKARGLNKKIVNPMDERRKSILEFCYVTVGYGSVPLLHWLGQKGWQQEDCALVVIDHFKDTYALFHRSQFSESVDFQGVMSGEMANYVSLSSVPKGKIPATFLNFNKDGYSKYCKDYGEYWAWVKDRNPERYANNIANEKNYDAKNMMHVFRLLNMAEEIAREGIIRVRRPEREYLLKIRSGAFEYDDLVHMAEEKALLIEELFEKSTLPDEPDRALGERLLVEIRAEFYSTRK
jgi:uncharacterized protein